MASFFRLLDQILVANYFYESRNKTER